MKKSFFVLAVLFLFAFASTPVVNAQPHSGGMFVTLMPEKVVSAGYYYGVSGQWKWSHHIGYNFNFFDEEQNCNMIHVYCNENLNFTVYSKKILSATAASFVGNYDPEIAKIKLSKYYGVTKSVLRDVITVGEIAIGDKNDPRVKVSKISSGKIVITYDIDSGEMKIAATDLMVEGKEKGSEEPFVFPEVK